MLIFFPVEMYFIEIPLIKDLEKYYRNYSLYFLKICFVSGIVLSTLCV